VKVQTRRDELERVGARVVFVSFDRPERLRSSLLAGVDLVFPLLVDESRTAYRAWGLRRSSVAGVWLDPRVWWQYISLVARGARLRRLGEDTLQLGGDFVIGPDGIVTWARPQLRDDRPPSAVLVREVEAASRVRDSAQ
jgi:hypothetical protein